RCSDGSPQHSGTKGRSRISAVGPSAVPAPESSPMGLLLGDAHGRTGARSCVLVGMDRVELM
ncbi:MAG TPA: hypothetical protein VIJ07_25330, partial [Dermatophilaceae bacterium]